MKNSNELHSMQINVNLAQHLNGALAPGADGDILVGDGAKFTKRRDQLLTSNLMSVSHEIWYFLQFKKCSIYRPHPKDGQGTVFTGVCLSIPGGIP